MTSEKQKNLKKNSSDAAADSEATTAQYTPESEPELAISVEQKLEQCQTSLAEWQEKYARLSADLDNFKKRTMKERSAWGETARADVLLGLIAIVDNFDRAMEHQPELSQENTSWADGIKMIHDSFKEYLKQAGVVEMPYDQFDPERHEALMQEESDTHEPGMIVSVMEKGYLLNDRVLRPAKVSVAK